MRSLASISRTIQFARIQRDLHVNSTNSEKFIFIANN